MDPDALVAQLRPIRLPTDYATFGPLDALAGFSVGVLVGLAVLLLLRPLLARRRDPVADARRAIAALAALPQEERVFGLARLLARLGAAAQPAGLHDALYARQPFGDVAGLEAAVLAAAKSRGGRR